MAVSCHRGRRRCLAPGPIPSNQLWFVRFDTRSAATAVELYAEAVPGGYSLAQNFPNPFNSQTVIRFELSAAAKIDLSIYNLQGQRVVVLAKGRQRAGTGQVSWNGLDHKGRPLPSGVYFYRLVVDGKRVTRKLVVLR